MTREYNEDDMKKVEYCCNYLLEKWKNLLKEVLEDKILQRFVQWRSHLSEKDISLPTSAFIDMIPVGKLN